MGPRAQRPAAVRLSHDGLDVDMSEKKLCNDRHYVAKPTTRQSMHAWRPCWREYHYLQLQAKGVRGGQLTALRT